MRKGTLLFLLMLFVSAFAFGQDSSPGDEFVVKSHLVIIKVYDGGRYGYELFDAGALILSQKVKPYQPSPATGFSVKDNARKMATAHVDILLNKENISDFTVEKARSIGITEEDL